MQDSAQGNNGKLCLIDISAHCGALFYADEVVPPTYRVHDIAVNNMYTKNATLTQKHVHVIRCNMGRKKLWAENINLTLPDGAKERMDAVLLEGESRLDLIRTSIDHEVERREQTSLRKKQASRK
ncbi:hypothetical protein [Tardiphaga sp. 813_E8_N1_3]|uniref:hypothetical protein n=1 Tax=Tardiphaga sp. 813_E8_N1_3 TaxID=3240760 RepID=UPI003F26ECB9